VNVHHATGAVGGDDHEAIVFAWFMFGIGVLANGGVKDRRSILPPNEVRLEALKTVERVKGIEPSLSAWEAWF
jgi:hypothetical protein